jgi:myo-inositol-1-phosphate synthase
LDEPQSFEDQEESKLSVLDQILQPALYPGSIRLPSSGSHQRILSRRQQEGWDTLIFFGWLGYPMQIKINFLCRDSILAAPCVWIGPFSRLGHVSKMYAYRMALFLWLKARVLLNSIRNMTCSFN